MTDQKATIDKSIKSGQRSTESRIYYQLLLITLLFISFLAFSLFLFKSFSQVKQADDLLMQEYEITRTYHNIYVDMLNMETSVRGFLLTGSDRMLGPYLQYSEKLHNDLNAAKLKAQKIPGEYKQMESWEHDILGYAALLNRQVNNKKNYREAIPSVAEAVEQKNFMDNLRLQIGGRIESKVSQIEKSYQDNNRLAKRFRAAIIFGNMLFFALCIAAFTFILRHEKRLNIAEAKVKRNESLYRIVLDAINDGVFEYNFDLKKIYLSKAHQLSLGYDYNPHGEDLETYKSRVHPEDLESLMEYVQGMVEGRIESYRTEFRMQRSDGEYIWLLSRAFTLHDSVGQTNKVVGVHVNIDDQKKRELELERLNSEMETFTYVTSHDLRSPLVNLKGFSRELQFSIEDLDKAVTAIGDKIDNKDKQKINSLIHDDISESINFIVNSVERMDDLTKALLDLARIGRYEIKLESVDTMDMVDKCIESYGFEIKENNIDISRGNLPVVVSDTLLLSQVFANLIDNSIKYRQPDVPTKIEVNCRMHHSEYEFFVKDNGRGIDKVDAGKVFEIFRRARNVGETRGQGLGMAFVRATVRRLGGDITFTSELGKGTTFKFTIPKKSLLHEPVIKKNTKTRRSMSKPKTDNNNKIDA